jgi:hypothetical protein
MNIINILCHDWQGNSEAVEEIMVAVFSIQK